MQLKAKGKTKEIYIDNNIIIRYTDAITALNGLRKDIIPNKGFVTSGISSLLFQKLNAEDFNTHFRSASGRDHICVWTEPLKVEVVVRNNAAGSIIKRLNLTQGYEFKSPIVEFYLKDDELGDPLLTENEIEVLELLPEGITVNEIKNVSLEINKVLYELFKELDLVLYDIKLEFGMDEKGNLILIDELSPDNMRIRGFDESNRVIIYDKDLYRQGHTLPEVYNAYEELYKALDIYLEY